MKLLMCGRRPRTGENFAVRADTPEIGTADERLPVVLFSHGDRVPPDDYDPLVAAWVAAGMVVLRPEHRRVPGDDMHWLQRVEELAATADLLDELQRECPALHGRLDVDRLRVAGHSFGAHTAAILLGARPRRPAPLPELRPCGPGVLLAPPGNAGPGLPSPAWAAGVAYLDMDWSPMRGEVLVVAGTNDDADTNPRGWRWHTDAACDAVLHPLMVLEGADHYLGGIAQGRGTNDAPTLAQLTAASVAMLRNGQAPGAHAG